MSVAYIDGKYACYSATDGIRKHFLGCRHERPRQAIAHTSGSYVSPLRESGHGSPVTPDPSPEMVVVEPSPESRNRLSGSGSTRGPAPLPVSVESPPELRRRGSRREDSRS